MTIEMDTSLARGRLQRPGWAAAALIATALLGGCTVTSTREAPVAERSTTTAPKPAASPAAATTKPAAPPRVPAADGSYVVQPGDTLRSIAAAFGRDVKDLARWNSIDDPSRIRVGQTLRVVPPAAGITRRVRSAAK